MTLTINQTDFTPEQKRAILERDDYRCVVCGGQDNLEIQVSLVQPIEQGGAFTVENGQTRCQNHKAIENGQTNSEKNTFVEMLHNARAIGDTATEAFCLDILATYHKHGVNGHIEWK
jgi:hypothetical protein